MSSKIIVKDRAGVLVSEYQIDLNEKVGFLKVLISKTVKKQVLRIHLTLEKQVLDDNDSILSKYGIKDGDLLIYKDLGPQIPWETVFYVEYLGPIFIFGGLYLLAGIFKKLACLQTVLAILGTSHFIKRVLETYFVHVFSRDSMPKKRLFINSIHYWIFFGLNIGVEAFFFWKDPNYSTITIIILVLGFIFSEFMNFMCHLVLKNLRKSGRKQRGIPEGFGFNQVSCANYFWEIMSWLFFSGLSRCWTSYFFLGLSSYQMINWALDKQNRYKKELGDRYPRNRKAIIPYLL